MHIKLVSPQRALLFLSIFSTSWLLFSAVPALALTYTVTNTNDSGTGSLRQAIINANNNAGTDTVTFNIASSCPHIIPTSPLPPIASGVSSPIIIDASSQACNVGGANAPNVELSGNGAGANAIGLYITGNGAGSTVRGLVINRFSAQGIFIDTSNVTIAGNYIGTSLDGLGGAGNSGDGIGIFSGTSAASANGNTVGGTTAADRNVISGNAQNGLGITAQAGGNASNNTVLGNYIGANVTGQGAMGNGGDGVLVNHANGTATANGNIIGGTTNTTPDGACNGACNVISANGANGVGLWHNGVHNSLVAGNYIGVTAAGTGGLGNGNIGVEVNETPNNTVGGTSGSARNILSGNYGAGLFLTGAAATGNVIEGNYIGTNANGTSGVGNAKMGIGIGFSPGAIGANSNTIGGTSGTNPGVVCVGACNLISGNGQNGIFITGGESGGHRIVGNYIGTNMAGSVAIGNNGDGIGIIDTPNTLIGDGSSGGRNIIASNSSNGVTIVGGGATGNRIDGNTIGYAGFGNTNGGVVVSVSTDTAIIRNDIYANGKLGIDLDYNGSINLNSPGGPHTGANRLQNFPDVYAAHTASGGTKIGGQFNGTPNTGFQLDFFYSDGCNGGAPQNYGQGQHYIGSKDISTDQFGNTAFGFSPGSAVPGNKYVTATATKKIGSVPAESSEFSKCVLVNAAKPGLTNGAFWFLKDYLTTGPGDKTFGYGFPDRLLMCAWDANQPGVKLPVVFSHGVWFMRASYTTGVADLTFNYGDSSSATKPVCGDWDGNGTDTVGVVDSSGNWSLRNSNSAGGPDAGQFQYGPQSSTPVVGDWDGVGHDNVGVVDGNNNWYLRGSSSPSFNFGFTPGYPVVGDWDGNGTDTIGSVNSSGTWAIKNTNGAGSVDGTFQFGFPGTVPILW